MAEAPFGSVPSSDFDVSKWINPIMDLTQGSTPSEHYTMGWLIILLAIIIIGTSLLAIINERKNG